MSESIKLKVLAPGEFQYAPGDEVRSDSVLATAGRIIDKACLSDAVGDHVFEGENGKRYGIFFEAHLAELDPESAEQLMGESGHGV